MCISACRCVPSLQFLKQGRPQWRAPQSGLSVGCVVHGVEEAAACDGCLLSLPLAREGCVLWLARSHAARSVLSPGTAVGGGGGFEQPDSSQAWPSGPLSSNNAGRQGQGEEYNWPVGLCRSPLIRVSHFGLKPPQKMSHRVESLRQRGTQQGM